ncbi:ATP-binding cassette, subfamily F, member 3 [Thermoanaerobacter thermohydrosulfuricus]|uniref:ATPase component of ABC transporter with duplicated ATPase domains n=2 Tax=Thermoanaerobacter thermohydrosulfuricus TaxID=1516 RepID=M8CXE2_THETY|nr:MULTISPECIES: ABC-F type ribosomal protection protein [Thermoanaerobacter]EMT39033.1 ATPase component of ABC transporter with duplicated ATPase domains [Thermoanaerobacter thermohydrosulfuricus WC1]UZQ83534.1 ABC-F type ribosomal protection protein [Thermoanaerobacter sp. RKWS2]SDF81214.1 ATP-binding cassette, subfamily F, member 3 [Thermoanaerobacter thermohydrosulfuricus]SFE18039.1 ATP-binding cassette, subfamily F, member 3 [Thermoanaerobacter thermohydrosulfuricus]
MAIITVSNVTKSYGIDIILQNISFIVNEGDKIGVIGENGAGKSTLFNLLAGFTEVDSGTISISANKIGYLQQNTVIESEKSIYEEVKTVFDEIFQLEKQIKSLEEKISQTKDSHLLDKLFLEYSFLTDKYNELDGYSVESKIRGVLNGLGFDVSQFDTPVSTLSGGQKTRLMLAKTLLLSPDVLLLDEPTNHLDINSIEWLEQYLKFYNGTILIISHDRYFLDKIVTRIFEIENTHLSVYEGNYTEYLKRKKLEMEAKLKAYEEQQKEIKRIKSIIQIQKNRRTEKSVKMAESKQKLLEKMEIIEKPVINNKSINLRFDFDLESGNDVLTVKNLSLRFDRQIFSNVSFEIKKGEKIALLGPNGIGKSSLLKILVGEIDNFEGEIKFGTNVITGYYEQEFKSLNAEKTVIDEIWDENPYLTQTEVRTLLASFLFREEDVFKTISTLSGGEKARLSLLKLILSKANFLLMDEPTNHLDLKAKEVLEEALLDYTGTLLFVSHDRYFIDKIATKVMILTPQGVEVYLGNYSYYIEKKNQLNEEEETIKKTKTQIKNERYKERLAKLKLKQQKEYLKNLENSIYQAEERIKYLEEKMCDAKIYKTGEIVEIQKEYNALKSKLEQMYEEWENLSG